MKENYRSKHKKCDFKRRLGNTLQQLKLRQRKVKEKTKANRERITKIQVENDEIVTHAEEKKPRYTYLYVNIC